jgi:excinuclease ABC subunit B
MAFSLISDFIPSGDQPEAIRKLSEGILRNEKYQTLLGVTGSGKTFTIANVIEKVQKPTLVLSHNKTLAAQLYNEFKQFFPDNAVEYFVSYYDYYQPEAYIPSTNTYIEKDLAINEEIEKMRLSTTSSLLSGRRDVIVVSSVSCLYGIGNPEDFRANTIVVSVGQIIDRNHFLRLLVNALYFRSDAELKRGSFRVSGDTVDVFIPYEEFIVRIIFFDDEIESIQIVESRHSQVLKELQKINIYPASIFVTTQERINRAVAEIQHDLAEQIAYFEEQGRPQEAKRIEERVTFDLEMIKELGYCSGIENYSRYFDGRKSGSRPFCLLDYFPDDFLVVIDESHVTIPQIRAMYGGDFSRKKNLVEYGYRLPAAIDNRPLKFEEFQSLVPQVIFMSATPADYELEKCNGVVVEQVVRPTGLLDPDIEVRPTLNQIDDLIGEVQQRITKKERILVTTLTKRMAEELTTYLFNLGIRCRYIHSDVVTLERVEILNQLREGEIDVLIGVNLLREGLDLPEVSLVAIFDADKEGFLRSERSLTQTAGRAARNVEGKVIMYADTITKSMQKTIDETNRRRLKQIDYNIKHHITPKTVRRSLSDSMTTVDGKKIYAEKENSVDVAADPIVSMMPKEALEKTIETTRKKMEKAATDLDFINAARYRDELKQLTEMLTAIKK